MHIKRSESKKTWAIPRKGTKYLVRPLHNLKNSIPLLIVLRDMLKLGEKRKEVKKILNLNRIKVNGKVVREEKFPLSLFDILEIDEKFFRIVLKNKKFNLVEIPEAREKIVKVIGKRVLKKGRLQINLVDGRNCLTDRKIKTGDSVVINLKDNKISEVLPFKQGCKIIFISGKHIGEEGLAEDIDEKKKKIAIKINEEKINAKLNSLMVIK